MAKQDELSTLRAELAQLKEMLGLGPSPSDDPADDPNFIAHGSPEHVQFIGLKVVEEGDDTTGYVVFESQETGATYRLEDEMGILTHFPGVDPDKAVILALRQKVNVIEAGEPTAPARTPSLWQPINKYVTLTVGG